MVSAAALFAILFLARFAFLVLSADDERPFGGGFQDLGEAAQSQSSYARKNYASSKTVVAQPVLGPQLVEQKYERVARLSSTSAAFDDDAAAALALAESMSAIVQSENAYGLPGARSVALTFGVTPEAFEGFVEGLRGLGSLESVTVIKEDKTADFRALQASRLSLEKTRDGLRALSSPGASLADLVALETKILEIEGRIQELGISLGDFDEGNSFCTVHYALRERIASPVGPRIAGALFESLEWSLLTFLGIALAVAATLGLSLLASIVVDKAVAYSRKP